MRRKLLLTAVLVAGVVGGCRHKCCSSSVGTPRPYLPLPPSPGNIPPPGVPISPAPGGQLPPADLGAFPGGSAAPRGPAPEILLPDPVPGGKSSLSSPGVLQPPARAPQVTQEPPVAAGAEPAGGVPGFVRVNPTAASGRRPALDGFDTLKRQGFRSVVYLHAAGADVAAVRDVAEKKGLTFTAIETTPETLPAAATAFDRALLDRSAQPVYVFDDDGLRAGALWYVRFRTADQLSPEVARIRARGLGLTDESDEARAYWVAIQQHVGR
ncbi:protein-tyrosine phosphatase family protein [Urbifossiella limnaea]|uniref:Uncharacterized protein n=1 Tax=Urbifossiella limnaea TaxID=2528023 RepID=A0A517XQZ9_9BACT|nr:hypothetical protein [Urbifossiella limnaea]QDU19919.1 hypothetical protein ETAA1_18580 [Urbifossiella limnaea]